MRLSLDRVSTSFIGASSAILERARINSPPMKPTKLQAIFGNLFPGPGAEVLVVKTEAQDNQQQGFELSWPEQGDNDGPVSGA